MKNLENQTISLAAIYQSCLIIQEIAWHGKFNKDNLEILINGIFITSPSSIYYVYKNIIDLTSGLNLLKHQFTGNNKNHEINKYFDSLLKLSNGLEKNEKITQDIQHELIDLKDIFDNKEITIDDKSTKISTLYTNTLSKIEPRIIISGDNKYLKDPMVASKIRTSLFVGLRSIFLWKEYGGSKIKNFFFKSRIVREIDRLLAI